MKCKYCGADLTMEDEVCPFCHNPNPYYVKHREDMHRYEQDYQETKSDVYETAGKTSRKATQIAILAVLGGLFLGTVVLNTNIWTVERMIQRHKIRNNISTHLAKLDQYLAEEDWASFTDYIDVNQLYFSGVDELEDYRYFRQLADDYNYIYESCMHLVDYENLDEDEYYYYTPDYSLEQIADSLKHMYDFVKKDEYSTYYEVYQAHRDWCDPILTEAEKLVQAYAGVDSEVIESGQIREMSRTKLVVLLERSYNKDES